MTRIWVVIDIAAFARQDPEADPCVAYLDQAKALQHAKVSRNPETTMIQLGVPGDVKVGYHLWLVCETDGAGSLRAGMRSKAAAIEFADRSGAYGHALEWIPEGDYLGLWDSAELDFPPQLAEVVISPVAVRKRIRL